MEVPERHMAASQVLLDSSAVGDVPRPQFSPRIASWSEPHKIEALRKQEHSKPYMIGVLGTCLRRAVAIHSTLRW